MRVLHILPSIDPQGGGPMEGVRNLYHEMKKLGHLIDVMTLDDPQSSFIADYGPTVYALGPSKTSYRYNTRLVDWLKSHALNYDYIVINGLWQYHGFGTWRALHKLKVPYFVFTHGMLDPWFKHAYPLKHLKKWLYWPWADYRVLRDASAVLFTCEEERLLARRSFWLYKVNEEVANYGTQSPPQEAEDLRSEFYEKFPELNGKRLFLFLSRIHEKKGCDLLIAAFAKAVKQQPDLHLMMAGPDHTHLIPKLKSQAEALGISQHITWAGMLQGKLKWGAFYASEVFILPSHQENFGIAVAEALGCGLPVLISNKVNIWREIEADGAGLVADDTLVGAESLIDRWMSLPPSAREIMRKQAKLTFQQRFTVEAMAESVLKIASKYIRERTGEDCHS